MPHSYNQAALAILANSMQLSQNVRLSYIKTRMEAFEQAVTVTLEYVSVSFNIIPEVENAIVDVLGKANPVTPNIQFHIASSPVMVNADNAFTEYILSALFSKLYDSIAQGVLLTVYVSKTEESGIIEIQEISHLQIKTPSFDHSAISTDQPLIVCKHLMEDMGGEMIFQPNEKGNYFRLKFLHG